MTNREWLFSLNDEQLSNFLTSRLSVHSPIYGNVNISVKAVSLRDFQSKGIEQWLKEPQEFEVLENDTRKEDKE